MQIKKHGMICPICGKPQTDEKQERCTFHGCRYVEGDYWEAVKSDSHKPEKAAETIIRL